MDPVFLPMRFHSMVNSFFIGKNIFFLENDLESPLILKGKQNKKKKTINATPYLEKMVYEKEKTKFGLRGEELGYLLKRYDNKL